MEKATQSVTETQNVSILYSGEVKLKFSSGNHCYYANGKICQGVTSGLKELYPQDDLLEWYSSMAAQDIVLHIAPTEWHDDLQKAFLEYYKDPAFIPSFKDLTTQTFHGVDDLFHLYKIGKDAPNKRSSYGKNVGTQVHEAVDRFHKTGEDFVETSGDEDQDDVAQKSLDMYILWFNQSGLSVVESERMVYSRMYNYAGTLDRIYETSDGRLILGDFKTSNLSKKSPLGVRDSYWSQLGAYMFAYSEEMDVKFDDAVIINSPKNGRLKVAYASDMGVTPMDLQMVFTDDLKALRNHKYLRSKQTHLKSRI